MFIHNAQYTVHCMVASLAQTFWRISYDDNVNVILYTFTLKHDTYKKTATDKLFSSKHALLTL